MKIAFLLAFLTSGIVLVSCSHNTQYVKKEDFMSAKKKIEKNRFAVKRALSTNIEIKKAFKEVNNQLKKQNKINKDLFNEIEEVKADIDKIKKEIKKMKKQNKKKKLKGYVLPFELNLRRHPYKTPSNVIKRLKQGEEVEVLKDIGSWYKVKAGKDEGYVYKNYLKIEVAEN